MQGAAVIKIIVGLVFLIIWIVRKAGTSSTPAKKFTQPPPPPPNSFSDSNFQHNPSVNQNPFQQQQNPFAPNPPVVPQNPFMQVSQNQNPTDKQSDINALFDDNKDAFSQASTRNTTSNMGAGTQSFYCMYCGKKFQSVEALSRDTCFKHPKSDLGLQKHVLYRGAGRPNVGF